MAQVDNLEVTTHIGPNDLLPVCQDGQQKKMVSFLAFSNVTTPLPLPDLSILATPQSVYRYQTVQFETNFPLNTATHAWSFGDGSESQQVKPIHTYFTPGVFRVTLTRTQDAIFQTAFVNITVSNSLTFAYSCGPHTEQLAASIQTNLFVSGSARNTNIWTGTTDWTCRGYNGNFTLITPSHAIYATHFGLPDVCQFVDSNNNIVNATVNTRVNIPGTDISVATFSAQVPNTVTPAVLAPVELLAHYYSATKEIAIPVVVLNSNGGLSAHTMMWVANAVFAVEATQAGIYANWPICKTKQYLPFGGDSGSPVFFLTPNGPLLITSLYIAVAGPSYMDNRAAIEAITGTLPTPNLSSYTVLY